MQGKPSHAVKSVYIAHSSKFSAAACHISGISEQSLSIISSISEQSLSPLILKLPLYFTSSSLLYISLSTNRYSQCNEHHHSNLEELQKVYGITQPETVRGRRLPLAVSLFLAISATCTPTEMAKNAATT